MRERETSLKERTSHNETKSSLPQPPLYVKNKSYIYEKPISIRNILRINQISINTINDPHTSHKEYGPKGLAIKSPKDT